ncbi:hypothetical protein TH9_15915 [Thalassospira xiamenensis]|nr:hypothetical protein TH9_15915 [Thalassospira xiamenensis]
MPLFEAVVNSIHAIEDRFPKPEDVSNKGRIDIYIHREVETPSLDLTPGRKPERAIDGFDIVDNGIGFTQTNWDSFNRLDFTYKTDKGCRGIGRLTWLKAFSSVNIVSQFNEGNNKYRRKFSFSKDREVDGGEAEYVPLEEQVGSKLELRGFHKGYASAVEKTGEAIAARLLEHTLWYFVRTSGVPRIFVHDEQLEHEIELNDLFDKHMHAESSHEEVEIKGVKFDITHVKFRLRQDRKHVLSYCAGQRLVLEEALDIPGLTSSVSDHSGAFRYAGYIVSEYLDRRVLAERTGFNIEDDVDDLFSDTEISKHDIRDAVQPLVKKFLGDALERNIRAGKDRLDQYISTVAPQYIPIVKWFEEEEMFVDPGTSDAQLDRTLHTKKYIVEQSLLEEGSKLLHPSLSENYDSYSRRIAEYMEKVQSVKQSDLAAYVTHRRVVLDILTSALNARSDGSYEVESVLHSLIMPMGATSEDIESLRGSNLWLLNERLAFHQHYLGSDKALTSVPITGSTSAKEPDLVAFNIYDDVYDNPHVFSDTTGATQATLTIVEVKRPMREGYKSGEQYDPIEQALGYLRRIREGGVMSKSGRPIPKANELPGYIYVVADLTSSLRKRCEYASLHEAPDGLSYFGWNGNPNIKAYIEVIDFTGLLNAAQQRNAAFFEHLGLPSNRL